MGSSRREFLKAASGAPALALTSADDSAARRVAIGDVVTIFDAQDGSRPEDFALSSGSSVYDLTMHLHADLPRRVLQP
jgi:hypothetical protein